MNEISSGSKFARRAGNLLALLGFAAYMIGLFGPARIVLFIGIALMIVSFAAFFIEEFAGGKTRASH